MSNSHADENLAISGVHTEVPEIKKDDFSNLRKIAFSSGVAVQTGKPILKKLIEDAQSASIPNEEIYELFSKPLAKDDISAQREFKAMLKSFREKIEYVNSSPSFLYRLRYALLKTQDHRQLIHPVEVDYLSLRDEEKNCFAEFKALLDAFHERKLFFLIIHDLCYLIGEEEWGLKVVTGQEVTLTEPQMEKAREFLHYFHKGYQQNEYLVNRIVPRYWEFKKKLWHMKRNFKIFSQMVPKPVSDVTAHEVFEPTDEQKNDQRFMYALDKVGFKKTLDVEDLAKLIDKSDSKDVTKFKAVKRWFRVLKPLGKPGEDYNIVEATEKHVRQGVAVEVGAPVYNYKQGRTAFDTAEAINVYWMVWMVKEVAQQLRKELKHKPSIEEVANEMGLEPSRLRYLYN